MRKRAATAHRYNHGARRVPHWPIPELKKYTTFMTPSVGVADPVYTRAVVIDDGTTKICMVTIDGIGADSSLFALAHDIAADQGFDIPITQTTMTASHSHSSAGAVSPAFLWAMAPATDLMVPELQFHMASKMADVMVQAYNSLQEATIGIEYGYLTGVTKNRRAKESPYLNPTDIDPWMPVIRIDDANQQPIATVWSFAIHGVCYGPDNMKFSADIMGVTNKLIKEQIGGLPLFIQADAGDIDPADGMCDNGPDFVGGHKMFEAVQATRANITTGSELKLTTHADIVDFGPTILNATLARFSNCTSGGFLDICTVCEVIHCDLNAHLNAAWIGNEPYFTGFRFDVGGKHWVMATMPGEPLLQLGWWTRNDSLAAGFDGMIIAGYSQEHMGYFATEREYDIGGYESQLTFWGVHTANKVRDAVKAVLQALSPSG